MNHLTTVRARKSSPGSALDETPVAPDAATKMAMARLPGGIFGLAKEVNRRLLHLLSPTEAFLRYLEEQTWGNAGWHRQQGRREPGSWCYLDEAAWAEALDTTQAAIKKTRLRLTAARIITTERIAGHPHLYRIGWNLAVPPTSWGPLRRGSTSWGGRRTGAGRPRTIAPAAVRVPGPWRVASAPVLPNQAESGGGDGGDGGRVRQPPGGSGATAHCPPVAAGTTEEQMRLARGATPASASAPAKHQRIPNQVVPPAQSSGPTSTIKWPPSAARGPRPAWDGG